MNLKPPSTKSQKNIYHKFGSQQSSVNNGYVLREKDLNSFRLIWLETFGSVVGFKDCSLRETVKKKLRNAKSQVNFY